MEPNDYTRPLPTPEEITQLAADGGTDALIARHLLGWSWNAEEGEWTDPMNCRRKFAPFFSRQIEEAWTIHVRMLNRVDQIGNPLSCWLLDRICALVQMPGSPLGERTWSVNLVVMNWRALIVAETAQLAICRAALWAAAMETEDG